MVTHLEPVAEVLTKPSISQQQLQGLVDAYENTGGDAAGVRYLCLGGEMFLWLACFDPQTDQADGGSSRDTKTKSVRV